MGRKLKDLTGQKFWRLTVIQYLGRQHHSSLWLCECECGTRANVQSGALKNGDIKSCGCWQRDRMRGLNFKHGERGGLLRKTVTAEYKCWSSMLDRCYRPATRGYEWYGGRGIKVCPEWTGNFAAFLRDVGRKPSRRHSLDRVDSNGNYEPGNVRWATHKQQARNRSNNRVVEFRGQNLTLVEAAELAGIPYKTVKGRLGHGWTLLAALDRPVNRAKVDAAERGVGKARGTS